MALPLLPRTDVPHDWRFAGCFGCGDGPGGLRMPVVAGPGLTATATFTVRSHHQGASGLAHGGAVAAAFDEVLGAVQFHFDEPAVTASLQTEFRLPVPVGSTLYLSARTDGRDGRKLRVTGEARLDDPAGPVAAQASALFVFVDPAHFERYDSTVGHEGVPVDGS